MKTLRAANVKNISAGLLKLAYLFVLENTSTSGFLKRLMLYCGPLNLKGQYNGPNGT